MLSETVVSRLSKLHSECAKWKDKASSIPLEERQLLAVICAGAFKEFRDFAEVGMLYLGFKLSKIQSDIAIFMQYGAKKRMVQAQRGQAKSTLAALYCIWLLIHNPSHRVLIVSGGGSQANDIALLIQRIILQWSILCWLRPDVSKGDRISVENFDVHYQLKGIDKSASIACTGITASLQGKRADFILADDVETQKNSLTQPMRETLSLLTKEFSAICISGEILYLGTPQTKDSIYRQLPNRGYDIRVWTGRYPTNDELARYGAGVRVAPIILDALLADPTLQTGGGISGKSGQPTDPEHISEEILIEKELEYGEEGFALQYMLDTTLADAMRTKIKLEDMIVASLGYESAPEILHWSNDPVKLVKSENDAIKNMRMFFGTGISEVFTPYLHKVFCIDPAGDGGDEVAYAGGAATGSYIFLLSVGGLRGGMTETNMNKILSRMCQLRIKDLQIEKNMGHGTVTSLFIAQVDKLRLYSRNPDMEGNEGYLEFKKLSGLSDVGVYNALNGIGITDQHATGQKEKRIIDTISPVTRRKKFVVSTEAIAEDWECCKQHPLEKRNFYSAFYQMGNITYDRQSLIKDDRADAIAAMTKCLEGFIAESEDKAALKREEEAAASFMKNPMGYMDAGYKQWAKGRGRNAYARKGSSSRKGRR